MPFNSEILDQIQAAGAKVIAVTKYLSAESLAPLQTELLGHPAVFGLGENRIASLETKNIPRENSHFIGRLQSRQFPQIIHYCGTIHSLDKVVHAEKINRICVEKNLLIKIFVQINISEEPQKGGIEPAELSDFLSAIAKLENVKVVGLSGMGRFDGGEATKIKEFQLLKSLRNEHLPGGLISAGTSGDYEIALKEGIDVVRVGRALWN